MASSDGDGDAVELLFPLSVGKAMLLRIGKGVSYTPDMDRQLGVLGRYVFSATDEATELLLWSSAEVLVPVALGWTSAFGRLEGPICGELLASPGMSAFRSVSAGIFSDGAWLRRDDSIRMLAQRLHTGWRTPSTGRGGSESRPGIEKISQLKMG
jgi:hypothetical protein